MRSPSPSSSRRLAVGQDAPDSIPRYDASADAPQSARANTDTSQKAPTKRRFHVGEDVLVCIGHAGVAIVSNADPLTALRFDDFSDIAWFAHDNEVVSWHIVPTHSTHEHTVHVSAPSAAAIHAVLERYVDERISMLQSNGASPSVTALDTQRSDTNAPLSIVRVAAAPEFPWVSMCSAARARGAAKESAALTAKSVAAGTFTSKTGVDLPPLPRGWVALFAGGGTLYVHTETRFTTRSHPLAPTGPLPDGWVEAMDPTDGARYFVHSESGHTTWDRPPMFHLMPEPAPHRAPDRSEWSAASDPIDGKLYYFHNVTKEAVWADDL